MTRVITYGTFDLFHEGHYRLLQRAKELGDYLIVGVCSEEYDRARGKLGVMDSLVTRMENVKKTGFADEIIVEERAGQKYSDIQKYHIDILTIGSDWAGKFDYLSDYCKVVYLERTKDISSTMLREQKMKIQRIGVIGSGRIAPRFVIEAKLVSGINVQGVYNPNQASVKAFADKWEIDCYNSLEHMYENVDAVYVCAPHQFHYEYIKSALEHGKHVLAEKPMVLKKAQAEELFALAKEKGLVLMEGIKTAYCPGFTKMLGIATSGKIGNIRSVEACFTKLENPTHRELTDKLYGGSFLELGSYCLLPIVKIFGKDYQELRFDSIKDENTGLDLYTKASFVFKNGLAQASCGLGVKSEGSLMISGTEGYILVAAPWWKTNYFEVHYENPGEVERYSDSFIGDGLRYEISDFVATINGNKRHEFQLTAEESIAIAGMLEKFRKD